MPFIVSNNYCIDMFIIHCHNCYLSDDDDGHSDDDDNDDGDNDDNSNDVIIVIIIITIIIVAVIIIIFLSISFPSRSELAVSLAETLCDNVIKCLPALTC